MRARTRAVHIRKPTARINQCTARVPAHRWKDRARPRAHQSMDRARPRASLKGPRASPRAWPCPGRAYSTLAPEAFTTGPHFSTSDLMKAANSSGVLVSGSSPMVKSFSRMSGRASMALIVAW